MTHKKTLVIFSGGLDSFVLAGLLRNRGHELQLLSFDYGQRHGHRELSHAMQLAQYLQMPHQILNLQHVGRHLGSSALTGDLDIPEGHYASESMRITVVPNRNAIMLSIACGIAVAQQLDSVAIGVHAGDHAIYPDCRPAFINAFDDMVRLATEGHSKPSFQVIAPFVTASKTDIVLMGKTLGLPLSHTWSCYKGKQYHCGKCGTCVERKEAFELAGVPDETIYQESI